MSIASVIVLCIALGVIGITFATRLRRIDGNVCLAQSVCFILFFTAPLGAVLEVVFFVLLVQVFFNSGEELEIV
jgi:hypothetical protein